LTHAIELLSDPTIVDGTSAQNFYHRGAAPKELYSFETEAAIEAELRVDKELREWAREHERMR
jgi:phosphoserine phosphatase